MASRGARSPSDVRQRPPPTPRPRRLLPSHAELKDVGPRVVAGDVEVKLGANDIVQIDLGAQDPAGRRQHGPGQRGGCRES